MHHETYLTTNIYLYVGACVCVRVCVCARAQQCNETKFVPLGFRMNKGRSAHKSEDENGYDSFSDVLAPLF